MAPSCTLVKRLTTPGDREPSQSQIETETVLMSLTANKSVSNDICGRSRSMDDTITERIRNLRGPRSRERLNSEELRKIDLSASLQISRARNDLSRTILAAREPWAGAHQESSAGTLGIESWTCLHAHPPEPADQEADLDMIFMADLGMGLRCSGTLLHWKECIPDSIQTRAKTCRSA